PWIVNSYVRFPTETLTAYVTGESTRLWAERWPSGPPRLALGLIVSGATALLTWSLAAVTVSVRPVLSWLLVASVVGGGLSAHAAEIRFSIHDLRAPGQVWDVRPVDLDGDGARDLAAFVVRDGFSANPRRFLALFYQRDGRFPLEPDQLVELPPQAVARAVADWEPQRRGAEIGWLTPDGIELWPRGPKGYGGERRVLVRDRGFFDMSSGNQLPSFRDLVADVDGDGRLDVLFPRKREAALWLAGEGGVRLAGRMPVRFRQSYGNRAKQILLGRFLDVDARGGRAVLVRVNRDRLLDVVTIRERRIACWLQKPGGRFGIDPDWEVKLDLLPLEGGKRDALDRVEVEIVDVDHDGWADCVVYRNTGKVGVFSSLRTQLLYFPGGPRGWRTGRPKQIVNLNGVSIAPVLLDVDNDGRRDLVLSSLRTDLITNVKRALFKSVKVTYYVYRFDRSRRSFEPSPGFRRDIDVDVERIEGGGTVPLAYFWGDYDGDGIRDMLTLATDDEVTIYPGRMRGGGFFSGERRLVYPEDEKTVLQLETSNSLWIEDLNGDGRHDLVFHYWADDYKRTERGKITVVLSR
ncbi:MAG: VCBS repeat-containing protein, partial [Planctomycetota bacterium]